MKFLRIGVMLCLAAGSLTFSACARSQADAGPDAATLLAMASKYGEGVHNEAGAADEPDVAPDKLEWEATYKTEIEGYLAAKDFKKLEKAAREARETKARVVGGIWETYLFYETVSSPVDNEPTEADWDAEIATLKEWESKYPKSATAKIALANSYENYAFFARGTSYADSVSDASWKLFAQRYAEDAKLLAEAAALKDRDPYWYEAMQGVALGQGWTKAQAKQLFQDAITFEPSYYHYYREYAYYLLPKWYGDPGESEALAEQAYDGVAGPQGKFIYFELASEVTCQCASSDSNMEYLSWPKIKEGYAALGRLYGYTNVKRNRFAHMAVEAGDREAAEQAFELIGDDWDHSVWRTSQAYATAKEWAAEQ